MSDVNIDQAAILYARLKNWTKVGQLIDRVMQPKVHILYAKVSVRWVATFITTMKTVFFLIIRPRKLRVNSKRHSNLMKWLVTSKAPFCYA